MIQSCCRSTNHAKEKEDGDRGNLNNTFKKRPDDEENDGNNNYN